MTDVLHLPGLFVDNQMTTSSGSGSLEVRSPFDHELVGTVTAATSTDVDTAVRSAHLAFQAGAWPQMTFDDRRMVVERAGTILARQADSLSHLISRQNGTIIRYPQGDTRARFAQAMELKYPEPELRGDALLVYEPAGVVAAITPWNAPLSLALQKVLPALLAGCTVVLKSSPETPLQDFALAAAFAEAGLPAGALNVLTADRHVSEELVRHPLVDVVSFTGSTAAGRRVGAACGERIRRAILELGGKSAAIVLDDIDIDTMASTVLHSGMLRNNGEACVAWSRILVPRSRHDELVEAFISVLEDVSVGDPLDLATDIGPLVAERQRNRVEDYIAGGIRDGARVVFGGGRPDGLDAGWFVEPTLLVEANNSMRICREEIFGPVGTVIPYESEEEAIRLANDTNYGLAGAIFTSDSERALDVASRVRAGTVTINGDVTGRYPTGGYKDSGIGRAGGREGFLEYLELKSVEFAAQR